MKKFFRSICILYFLQACCLPLSAQYVGKDVALGKANAFLNRSGKSRAVDDPSSARQLSLANDRDEFYVFNDEDNGGWVIVSGEERMPDVLGFSPDGNFDADNIPCNMKAWLEDYARQVDYLRAHPEAMVTRSTTSEREDISPLLTCWFDQDAPYNSKCPEIEGVHSNAGCVATAMAQVMYYYQWPKQTTDTIPGYTTKTLEIEMPAIPVTAIDWDNVLSEYQGEGNYGDAQTDAIATLMLLCGCSVQTNYKKEGSGANYPAAIEALRHYFDYDDGIEEFDRDSCDTEVWEQMIYDELTNRRPVLYRGIKEAQASGHAFVIDGYREGYFHINWGWGGQDAYVLMTSVDGWEELLLSQGAVFGIQPASGGSTSLSAVPDDGKTEVRWYDMGGRQREHPRKGLNITRMSNGTTKKILIR